MACVCNESVGSTGRSIRKHPEGVIQGSTVRRDPGDRAIANTTIEVVIGTVGNGNDLSPTSERKPLEDSIATAAAIVGADGEDEKATVRVKGNYLCTTSSVYLAVGNAHAARVENVVDRAGRLGACVAVEDDVRSRNVNAPIECMAAGKVGHVPRSGSSVGGAPAASDASVVVVGVPILAMKIHGDIVAAGGIDLEVSPGGGLGDGGRGSFGDEGPQRSGGGGALSEGSIQG